ncbi:MAG: hypothetical protein HZB10_01365 [Candidatus Yonathbacteria bacterium]|nr:hypothetical protein [Candidatus Yonathbacteria bacterium]
MKTTITFTNNMSADLMEWLEKYSAHHKVTRRAILEKALNEFRKSARKREYAQSFKKASLDSEIKSMSEDGLGDYLKQLSHFDK